nr:hypothetical protein Iba_chr12dCG9640 [Ipomoea batatas]
MPNSSPRRSRFLAAAALPRPTPICFVEISTANAATVSTPRLQRRRPTPLTSSSVAVQPHRVQLRRWIQEQICSKLYGYTDDEAIAPSVPNLATKVFSRDETCSNKHESNKRSMRIQNG